MPKSGAPISHDAIKRSLKSKFRLILSENRILMDTVNGYVKKAEKVYKDMEASEDVSPRQFAKAMEKLERTYSACVRLIMVASELFEKGDSEGTKNRDLVGSSCESETSVFSSESSMTITDTNRARKTPNEKTLQRRSKSSDVALHDVTRLRLRPQPACRKSRAADVTEKPGMEVANTETERLFIHPGGNSDFDQLIELQRFLHGLENEKQQTDHPNPCPAKEKQLSTYKMQRESVTAVNKEEDSKDDSVPHSLPQRLKVLKSAIENFRDRSSGDERIAQALSDIRDLVLKTKDSKESLGEKEVHPECYTKDGFITQVSPVSESQSTEDHLRTGPFCSTRNDVQGDEAKELPGNELNQQPTDVQHGNKNREDFNMLARAPQSTPSDGRSQKVHHSESGDKVQLEHAHQVQKVLHEQPRAREQLKSSQQNQISQHPAKTSPAQSPRASGDGKDDINQIIVNRIVDMVSAKLVPRLQHPGGDNVSAVTQHDQARAAESSARNEQSQVTECVGAPSQLACSCFPQSLQQGNCCGSCGHIPKIRLYYQPEQHQTQLHKLQRRPQRPKMVSFLEDSGNGGQCNAWDPRYSLDPRQMSHDPSPAYVTRQSVCKGDESEPQHHHPNPPGSRYISPHKKSAYNTQELLPQQLGTNHQQQLGTNHQQQLGTNHQQHLPVRRILHSEDMFVTEHKVNVDKDEESEQVEESDLEIVSECLPAQHHDSHSKTASVQDSLASAKRPAAPKGALPFEASEYVTIHHVQRGSASQHQAAVHKNESYNRNLNTDLQQTCQAVSQDREWLSSPQQTSEYGSIEGNKMFSKEGSGVTRFSYRLPENASCDQRAGEYSSPDNVSVQHQNSQMSMLAHPQQPPDGARPCPPRMPRSITPQTQPHHPVAGYPNIHNTGSYGKVSNYEPVQQTSCSSCEGSPAFSGEEKLHGDNTTSSHDESEGKEHRPQNPEVVCIDAMQLHADASRTITLSNLPLDLNEKELLSIFKKYGHVTKIYYIRDRTTGMFQGRAYGKFSKATEAFQAAQDLQNLMIDGHEISVQLYVNTP